MGVLIVQVEILADSLASENHLEFFRVVGNVLQDQFVPVVKNRLDEILKRVVEFQNNILVVEGGHVVVRDDLIEFATHVLLLFKLSPVHVPINQSLVVGFDRVWCQQTLKLLCLGCQLLLVGLEP